MSKYKTEFELETIQQSGFVGSKIVPSGNTIKIIGAAPKNAVYVAIEINGNHNHFIKKEDLEIFAVNILRALKSKKLNPE